MSKIDAMIQELCPDGVEYKTLGEVADFKYGYTAKAQDQGSVRFVRITDISENYSLKMDGATFVDVVL